MLETGGGSDNANSVGSNIPSRQSGLEFRISVTARAALSFWVSRGMIAGQRPLTTMYNPKMFREERLSVLLALMREHPLATLITHGEQGIQANLIPFILVAGGEQNQGILRAHLARANTQLNDLRAGAETLVIFQGPEAYITPSWYASKAEHGKVVPTWNYVMVQARGLPRVIDDPAWIRDQIDLLTTAQEHVRAEPWAVTDAPETFVAAQLQAIVGVEIPISHIEGKWKVSQNRSDADQAGVRAGLNNEGGCPVMAGLIGGASEPASDFIE
jgi:transcriptional regulator